VLSPSKVVTYSYYRFCGQLGLNAVRYNLVDTAWGYVGVIGTERGISRVILGGSRSAVLRKIVQAYGGQSHDRHYGGKLIEQLRDYFRGRVVQFDVEVDLSALSDFSRRTLQATREVPYGTTISYGQLAKRVWGKSCARAVGQVMKRNPVPLIIPCHRVVGCNGELGGYSGAGGTRMKRRLLKLEGAI